MEEMELFLAHAIRLERDAAEGYDGLRDMMKSAGNTEVAAFFADMGRFARMHLAEAMERGGFRDIPELAPGEFRWLTGDSPEAPSWEGVDVFMDVQSALLLALEGEIRSQRFYAYVRDATEDPEVRRSAAEFAEEEEGHVAELQKWIARQPAVG